MTSAREIVIGLGGRWVRSGGTVRCPAHEDRSPSLSVSQTRDGRPLVFCHAGCSQRDVIDALRARNLWTGEARPDPSYPGRVTLPHDGIVQSDDRERMDKARSIWDAAHPIGGTLGEAYLLSRAIKRPIIGWPDALRFASAILHAPSKSVLPAMIAAVTDGAGTVTAIQRTYLDHGGEKKADVKPAKMTIGPMGNGAVRLGRQPRSMMGIAEGVETALSASQLYHIPVWATLAANRLGKLHIPKSVESLIIFADAGEVGMEAAFDAADTYERPGLRVDVMPPSVHHKGQYSDFNDVIQERQRA
jgi:hypothetical protein